MPILRLKIITVIQNTIQWRHALRLWSLALITIIMRLTNSLHPLINQKLTIFRDITLLNTLFLMDFISDVIFLIFIFVCV